MCGATSEYQTERYHGHNLHQRDCSSAPQEAAGSVGPRHGQGQARAHADSSHSCQPGASRAAEASLHTQAPAAIHALMQHEGIVLLHQGQPLPGLWVPLDLAVVQKGGVTVHALLPRPVQVSKLDFPLPILLPAHSQGT